LVTAKGRGLVILHDVSIVWVTGWLWVQECSHSASSSRA